MSTYQSFFNLDQIPNTTPALSTSYGEGPGGADAGFATLPMIVSGFDFLTVRIEMGTVVGVGQLDLQVVTENVVNPFSPLRDPATGDKVDPTTPSGYATALANGLPEPQDMTVPLRPSDLTQDLDFQIGNVAARVASGSFKRDLTIDVRGLSMIAIRAKVDAGSATLALSVLPHAQGPALGNKAGLGY